MRKLILLFLILNFTTIFPQWQSTGPWGGEIFTLATGTNKYYAATSRQLYTTSSLLHNWNLIAQFETPIVSILSSEKGKLFIGKEDGLLMSNDGGKNFSDVPLFKGYTVFCAFEYGDTILVGTNKGIFVSKDNGNAFIQSGLANKKVLVIKNSSNKFFFGTEQGLYTSSDLNNYTLLQSATTIYNVSMLAFDNKGRIVCGSSYGSLYYSSNQIDFQEIKQNPSTYYNSTLTSQDGIFFIGTYCRVANGQSLYSFDGTSLTQNLAFPARSEVLALVTKGDTLLASSFGAGLFYSTDLGYSWKSCNQGIPSHVTAFAASDKFIFASTFGGGVFRSSDLGLTWNPTPAMIPISFVNCLFLSSSNVLYAGTADDCIYQSTDNGQSWETTAYINKTAYCIIESNGQLFAGTPEGLIKSIDGFKSYELLESFPECRTIFVDQTHIILGNKNGEICISSDNGKSWKTSMPANLPIMGIVKNSNDIYAGTLEDGVFISKDFGQTWNPLSDGISNKRIFSLSLINKTLICGTDGWQGGLFYLDNSSNQWIRIQTTDIGYFAITTISQIGNKLFIGTWGNAAWSQPINNLNLPVITDVKNQAVNSSFILKQNYPNPFNPSTRIKYSIPQKSFVRLSVFDILGREVTTLVNGEQDPGNYDAEFDGSKLTSGTYLCRLQSGNFSQTRKLMLVK